MLFCTSPVLIQIISSEIHHVIKLDTYVKPNDMMIELIDYLSLGGVISFFGWFETQLLDFLYRSLCRDQSIYCLHEWD